MQAWLAENGPVHVLVDGANVALYGQNWEHGGFSFGQIKGVVDEVDMAHPDLHPLMVCVLYQRFVCVFWQRGNLCDSEVSLPNHFQICGTAWCMPHSCVTC